MLFHLNSFWRNEAFTTDAISLKERLRPGTRIGFLMKTFRQSEYGNFSEEEIIHQALALWEEDDQPGNKSRLLKAALGEFACPAELRSTRVSDSNDSLYCAILKGVVPFVLMLICLEMEVPCFVRDVLRSNSFVFWM